MDGVMFHCRNGFQVFVVIALDAVDEVDGHAARQERVFAIGFLTPAPARVAEDVDVRRPEGQPAIHGVHIFRGIIVMLGAALVGNRRGDLQHQVFVPGRGQANCLREDGCVPCARDPVQGLVPPIVFVQTKARNAGSLVIHLGGFLFQRHAADEIPGAGFRAQGRVHIGQDYRRRLGRGLHQLSRRFPSVQTRAPGQQCDGCRSPQKIEFIQNFMPLHSHAGLPVTFLRGGDHAHTPPYWGVLLHANIFYARRFFWLFYLWSDRLQRLRIKPAHPADFLPFIRFHRLNRQAK